MVLKNPHINSHPIAFTPPSSTPLRLTLLFPTLSIKSYSAGGKKDYVKWRECTFACRSAAKVENRSNSTCALNRSNARLAQIKSWQRSLTAASHTVYLTSTLGPVAPWQILTCCLSAERQHVCRDFSSEDPCPHMTLICNNLLRRLISLNISHPLAHVSLL